MNTLLIIMGLVLVGVSISAYAMFKGYSLLYKEEVATDSFGVFLGLLVIAGYCFLTGHKFSKPACGKQEEGEEMKTFSEAKPVNEYVERSAKLKAERQAKFERERAELLAFKSR